MPGWFAIAYSGWWCHAGMISTYSHFKTMYLIKMFQMDFVGRLFWWIVEKNNITFYVNPPIDCGAESCLDQLKIMTMTALTAQYEQSIKKIFKL